jgi:hypothetical protein
MAIRTGKTNLLKRREGEVSVSRNYPCHGTNTKVYLSQKIALKMALNFGKTT